MPQPRPLSRRQLDVLRASAEGLTSDAIGRRLHISVDSVKTHARAYRRKLGAVNATHAVALAYQAGILDTPDAIASAKAEALRAFADSVRTTEVLFRRPDGSGVKVTDLLRETAQNYIEEADGDGRV